MRLRHWLVAPGGSVKKKTPTVDLRCRICDVEIELSRDDPTMRMAQIRAFAAAHDTHEQGPGVEIVINDTDTDTDTD
jgi:hypothetical protein